MDQGRPDDSIADALTAASGGGCPPRAPPGDAIAANLCVIIPTLNAAATLAETLAALGRVPEIIVVDGASSDATVAIAAASGAVVLTAPRGRGSQLAAGVAAATQPWLLLLHADTRLAPDWRAAAQLAPAQAGYFRFCLDAPDHQARRLERLVAWRNWFFGLPYGDQGLLIHRDLLRAAGGVRPLPLMEDVDLVRRLGRARLVPLAADAVTSARKWREQGYLRRSARNLVCVSLWFAGVPPRLIQLLYQ
ncbi:TIGR04283 family arsenosugar biosynthesis glycosyltransferase [Rhodopila sp.]|uniref:TIGR04283 family arsenosugar biosynthesis glycosyltransferase n=1 Tax=Rhodopila sp. TaxID=2480087 RepID=UPI003D13E552